MDEKSSVGSSEPTTILLWCILFVGIVLRTFQFPNNPPGLFVDEASIGYESFSLLNTGTDRWGNRSPIYFLSWGSGQSVMYAYLALPFIALWGLTPLAVRLPSLCVGVLTLPLFYVTARKMYGRNAALLSTSLLAIMPWHIMISRWALDANLLPFFLLLGTLTTSRALSARRSHFSRYIALLPWAISLYAYAIAYLIVPLLLVLVLLFYRETILKEWQAWLVGFALFVLVSLPIVMLLAKNLVVHDALAIEPILPFAVPALPYSRLEQVSSPLPSRLAGNLLFVFNGFQIDDIRASLPGIAPTFVVVYPLVFVGAVYLAMRYRQSKRADLFLLWLAACLPIPFIVDLAIHRINAIFVPMLAVATFGLLRLVHAPGMGAARKVLVTGVGALVALQAIVFMLDYFLVYPTQPETEVAFSKGFDRALHKGLAVAGPSDDILVTDKIDLPYSLTAFFADYPPDRFRRDVRYTMEYGTIYVHSLGRFYFGKDNLPNSQRTYTFVLAKWDAPPCEDPKTFLETRLWQVGRCESPISIGNP